MCSPIHYSSIDHISDEDKEYYEIDENMFTNKLLFIPDYIHDLNDATTIKDYFEKFNIAKIKNVEIIKYFYYDCYYAIIEVDKWYINRTSINFYNNLMNNTCKMVYDDPHFWRLYVYEYVDDYYNYINNKETVNETNVKLEENDENDENYNISEDEYNYIFEESDNEEDDETLDKDYVYSEDELFDDEKYYEYSNKIYKIKDSPDRKRKRKYSLESELANVKEEVNNLKKMLIKKNKNYLKNNKSKDYKNAWTRRLRQKQDVN